MWHVEFSSGAKSKKSLIYSSKDGTLFALNSLRVAFCAPGLPLVPPESIWPTESETPSANDRNDGATNPTSHLAPNTNREPIPLPEMTKTLSVLFQFILPKPPPTLENLYTGELVDILKAARKYKVYTAISIGESQLLSHRADEWDAEFLFVYGIENKLPRFMDAGSPGVYRNIGREKLLEICNDHGVLYAWTRYQLLWDRIIEDACAVAFSSIPYGRKEREIHKHYDNLRSLHWTKSWIPSNDPEDHTMTLFEEPKVSYQEFLAMLDSDTLVIDLDDRPVDGPVKNTHPRSSGKVSVKHINDKIKAMIEKMPMFSSFLWSSQMDGDVAFERDGLDSSEEEDEEQEEKQDGSG